MKCSGFLLALAVTVISSACTLDGYQLTLNQSSSSGTNSLSVSTNTNLSSSSSSANTSHSSSSASSSSYPAGIVAEYLFNGNANDSSGNGLNGTVNGAVLTNDRFGNANSAYYFNGSTSYIQIPLNSAFIQSNFTVFGWILANNTNNPYCTVLDSTYNGNTAFAIFMNGAGYGSSSGELSAFLGNHSRDNNFFLEPTNKIQLGSWTSFAYTRSGNTANLYINGNLVQSTNDILESITFTNMTIGDCFESGTTANFAGTIDDLYFYNYALTSAQIYSLTTNSSSVSTNTSFSSSSVSTDANFSSSSVSTDANFSSSSVSTNTNFSSSSVSTNTNFSSSSVSTNTNFSSSSVSTNTNFSSSSVSTSTSFSSSSVSTSTSFSSSSVSTSTASSATSSTAGSYPAGIIAEYSFSGNANDSSGYGNNGTLVGNPVLTNDRFGNSNSAFYFDGASAINVADNPELDSLSNQISVSFWIYGGSTGRVMGKIDNGNPCTGGWFLQMDSSCRPNLYLTTTNGTAIVIANTCLTDMNWHNIAFTANANTGNCSLYVDGAATTTNCGMYGIKLQYTPEAANPGCSNLTMGMSWGGGLTCMTGILDDVNIYNYELTSSMIQSIATNN
jgi:hypothetical protein